MSALGHKRTFAVQKVMSALPPIADMCSAQAHVRYVPIADIEAGCELIHTWWGLSCGNFFAEQSRHSIEGAQRKPCQRGRERPAALESAF